MIQIGTSGFDYEDWRGIFYPNGLPRESWLAYYAEHFSALELNFSYYRMPSARQIESMVRRTDSKVTFAVKAHRSMTHERHANHNEYVRFIEALRPLREAGRLGAVLAQFPTSFHQTEENRKYIKQLADRLGTPLAVEFRQRDWAEGPVIEWIRRLEIGYVCVDQPQLAGLMPPIAVATAAPAYVRFHGRNADQWYEHDAAHERYDYAYSRRELADWSGSIRDLERQTGHVLVFFNNHFQGKAADSAKQMEQLLGQR